MYLGRRFRFIGEDRIYNNGGPSYVLNQASVGLLASHLDDDACQPHAAKHWEDILVSSASSVTRGIRHYGAGGLRGGEDEERRKARNSFCKGLIVEKAKI